MCTFCLGVARSWGAGIMVSAAAIAHFCPRTLWIQRTRPNTKGPLDRAAPETTGVAQMTLEGLRPTTAVLSILYLSFALAHTRLPQPLSTILVPWVLCSSVLLLWLRWELRQSHKIWVSIRLTNSVRR